MPNGGNSHQRKVVRKARKKSAKVADKLAPTPTEESRTVKEPVTTFWGFASTKQAALWLWARVWDWPFVSQVVAAICIGLAYLVAQEHMYVLSRSLVGAGVVLVFFKIRHSATKADISNEVKRVISVLSFIVLTLVSVGGVWIIHNMQRAYVENLPRADLHVDDVTIEIGRVGANYPMYLTAHIRGHNASLSVPTKPYPRVQASISARPLITQDHVKEEEDLFTPHAGWANEAYVGFPYVLNPSQTFSFSTYDTFPTLNTKGVKGTGNIFLLDNWNALQRGDIVLYVVTRAIYSDKWGRVPEVRTCSIFSARDNFSKRGICWGQFKLGTYQP